MRNVCDGECVLWVVNEIVVMKMKMKMKMKEKMRSLESYQL